jgi:probable HAF family extracellular repeat protein
MPWSRLSVTLSFGAVLLVPLLVVSSCSTEAPTSPAAPIDAAKAATAGPTVTSADPTSAPQSTTLDVRVLGTGYDRGSRALWALDGDTTLAVTKVKTNTTRYVSAKELVANITIAADASLDRYDIMAVTSSGKKGIGIERFTVTPELTLTAIGPAKGGVQAEDVNDQGWVVGNTGTIGISPRRAFIWIPTQPRGTAGTFQDLGTFGGPTAATTAINNSGHVVGNAATAGGGLPFLWTKTAGMQNLGLDPLWTSGSALDINEVGQVAGIAQTASGSLVVIWNVRVDAAGVVQVLSRETVGAAPAGGSSTIFAINNMGQLAGWVTYSASTPNHAVVWTPSPGGWTMEDLGLLPGDYASGAYGINDLGQVVGWSRPQQGCVHAALWTTQEGKLTGARALEALGGCSAEGWAINNQSQIVGRLTNSGRMEATMWTLAGDASTASIRILGRLSGTASSLGLGLSSSVGGLTQVSGLSHATTEDRGTLWTVR